MQIDFVIIYTRRMFLYKCISLHTYMYMCIYIYILNAHMYICIHVCMYVCMYVCVYIYIHIHRTPYYFFMLHRPSVESYVCRLAMWFLLIVQGSGFRVLSFKKSFGIKDWVEHVHGACPCRSFRTNGSQGMHLRKTLGDSLFGRCSRL